MCPKRTVTTGKKRGWHAPLRVQGEATRWQSKAKRRPRKAKVKMLGSSGQAESPSSSVGDWSAGRLTWSSTKSTWTEGETAIIASFIQQMFTGHSLGGRHFAGPEDIARRQWASGTWVLRDLILLPGLHVRTKGLQLGEGGRSKGRNQVGFSMGHVPRPSRRNKDEQDVYPCLPRAYKQKRRTNKAELRKALLNIPMVIET